MNFEINLKINYKNYANYIPCFSAWSGNHIAIGAMREDSNIESIEMIDRETNTILKTYVRSL